MISACITDPFAGRLRIKDSRIDAFTLPRNGVQAAGCTKPSANLQRKDDLCQLRARIASWCAFDQQPSRESASERIAAMLEDLLCPVCRPMHSLPMARINGSPLRVDAESLSPSQCDRLQFQKRDVCRVSEGRWGGRVDAAGRVAFCGVTLRHKFLQSPYSFEFPACSTIMRSEDRSEAQVFRKPWRQGGPRCILDSCD
jgi:hypothetical protein